MKIRKFWMKNGNEQTIQFADSISKIFINNPTGLGVSNTLTTNQYTDKLDLINSEQNFHQIGGEYLFYDVENKDKYEQYNNFITFLTHKPLTLYYQIPTEPVKTYSIDVDVLSIDKTEVKTDGALRCNFSLQALSRWKGEEVVINLQRATTFDVVNDGHMPVGFEINITNITTTPSTGSSTVQMTFEQNGDVYGVISFRIKDGGGGAAPVEDWFRQVYVNSNDGEQNVVLRKQSNVIIPNPLSYQDLTVSNGILYMTFVKLARGTSTLKFEISSYAQINVADVELKFTPIYRSV